MNCSTVNGILPCSTPGPAGCSADGLLARVCDGALEADFDCAAIGGTCTGGGSPMGGWCTPPGSTCDMTESWVDACAGSTIAVCVAGQSTAFDCSTVGLLCLSPTGGGSGYCGPCVADGGGC